jgi:hypothetical protein
LWAAQEPGAGLITFVLGLAYLLFHLAKARVAFVELAEKAEPHELEAALHIVETVLLGPDNDPAKRVAAGLRLTFHVPDAGRMVQVCEYVGAQRRAASVKSAGRSLPDHVGVVGEAYRLAVGGHVRLCADSRAEPFDHPGFVRQMMDHYHFSNAEAMALSPGTSSWLGYAITSGPKVYGVVYADSLRADFFTEGRKEDFTHAMVGFAYFVVLRYS